MADQLIMRVTAALGLVVEKRIPEIITGTTCTGKVGINIGILPARHVLSLC